MRHIRSASSSSGRPRGGGLNVLDAHADVTVVAAKSSFACACAPVRACVCLFRTQHRVRTSSSGPRGCPCSTSTWLGRAAERHQERGVLLPHAFQNIELRPSARRLLQGGDDASTMRRWSLQEAHGRIRRAGDAQCKPHEQEQSRRGGQVGACAVDGIH